MSGDAINGGKRSVGVILAVTQVPLRLDAVDRPVDVGRVECLVVALHVGGQGFGVLRPDLQEAAPLTLLLALDTTYINIICIVRVQVFEGIGSCGHSCDSR